ncbi:MAG: class I SAM-dependent methyltransferase [Bacteroidales bacterium]|nr:class I SAM-dependent methyltransferase [Bacteroidales bacterium]
MALLNIYKKQLFSPNLLSLFINPFYIIRRSLYYSIKKYAPSLEGELLDFGCGDKPYKSLFNKVEKYIGLDIENEAHSHEKEEIDVYYDGRTIPFNNGHFDVVFSSEVFEHVFDIENVINEIHRVIKPGGKLFITVPFTWNEHEIPNDFGRYTSFGIRHLLEKNGFEIISLEKSGHFAAVIAQLIMLYIYELIATKNKYLNLLINSIFVAPFTILGVVISTVLPKRKSLYFNNIVLAKKN